MIHPDHGRNLKVHPSDRVYIMYYSVAFLICLLNFIPMSFCQSYSAIDSSTKIFLQVCYLMSLPLVFEFILDTIAAQFQSLSALKDLEHRFGHGLLLMSLFLVIFLVPGLFIQEISAITVINIFALLQSVVFTGVFGKLQAHGHGHWTVMGCWLIILLFVLSEVFVRFGMIYHDQRTTNNACIVLALLSFLLCFCFHFHLSKGFFGSIFRVKVDPPVPSGPTNVDDVVCFILQAIISLYLIASLCSSGVFLVWGYGVEDYANLQILKQLILAMCAVILPGRMIRRSFILLKNELNTKESFVRYLSHEIRSPLSTTSLGLDYLIERMSTDPSITIAESLTIVQESKVTCELAMNTLNDFLMLDKIQSNMIQISTVECAASSFMVNTVKSFRLLAMNNGVDLSYASQVIDGTDILGLPITVNVDQFKINQVIRNLCTNALKFTGPGGSIKVSMSLRYVVSGVELESLFADQKCMVRYSVTDTGCGISKENLPKLFGQYVQFDSARLQGGKGSGLGLWLSKAIVELHRGRMGASSEGEGKGSTFWFELPCEVIVLDKCIKRSNSNSVTKNSITVVGVSQSMTYDIDEDHLGALPDMMLLSEGTEKLNSPTSKLLADIPLLPVLYETQPGDTFPCVPLRDTTTLKVKARRYSLHTEMSMVGRQSHSHTPTGLKILLVDDSAISRKFVQRSLSKIEAECYHAENGREAVDKVRESLEDTECAVKYDVILMDYYMPEMLGPAAIVAIRALGYKGMIIAVSGLAAEDSDFNALLESGDINRIMQKPFNLEIFEAILKGKSHILHGMVVADCDTDASM